MQQTLTGCAFCDSPPGIETGETHTWGQDERVTHSICVDCAIQTGPDPDERGHASLIALVECALVELTHEHVGAVVVTSGTVIK